MKSYLSKTIGEPASQAPDMSGLSPFEREICRQLDDIEELRACYRAVSPAQGAPTSDMDNDAENEEALAIITAEPSSSVGLLQRPRLIVGSLLSLCILVSAVYAGLGYWWMTSESHAADAPTMMLSLDEAAQSRSEARQMLDNIKQIQNESQGGISQPDEKSGEDGATTMLAASNPMADMPIAPEDKVSTGLGLKSVGQEPVGRADPFSPLVQENGPIDTGAPQVEKNPMDSLQYTGFIGDIGSKDKVAVIRVLDPVLGNKTVIKKAGESFTVEGETFLLQAIAKNTVHIKFRGATRKLVLSPYTELHAGSGSGVISSSSSVRAGAIVGSNAGNAAAAAAAGNAKGNAAETDVKLAEPDKV